MEEVPADEVDIADNKCSTFLNKFKDNSTTTNIPLVFFESAPMASGKPFDDLLMVGPIVKDTRYYFVIRFQLTPIAISADFERFIR